MFQSTYKADMQPYQKFSDATKQLANIAAIDYFFAKQIIQSLVGADQTKHHQADNQQANNQQAAEQPVLFHLLMTLSDSLRQGHSCLPLDSVANSHYGFQSGIDNIVTHQGFVFPDLAALTEIVTAYAIAPSDDSPVVFCNKRLFMRRYYNFEQELQAFINQRCAVQDQTPQQHNELNIKACLAKLFTSDASENKTTQQSTSPRAIDWQKVAVANALNKSFTVIAGGPGTGKTYTVTKLLAALISLSEQQLAIALVAPTGKAAQRMAQSINSAVAGFIGTIDQQVLAAIPKQAQTIHRLLGVIANQPNFRHHQDNQLQLDVILIDEFSMVDLPLMTRIIRALPARCKVILLGDADQLPSVAAGSVLADLAPQRTSQYSQYNTDYITAVCGENLPSTKSKQALDHVTFLVKSRRFDGQGAIGKLAYAVIAGDSDSSWQLLQTTGQQPSAALHWLDSQIGENLLPTSRANHLHTHLRLTWLTALIKQYYAPLQQCATVAAAFQLFNQFRVLVATRNGETGLVAINQLIDQQLSYSATARANTFAQQESSLYHGKPIMITENHYQLGLYNGDIGFIWRHQQGHLMAVFQQDSAEHKQGLLWILPSRLPNYEAVYAMTIHKTQGSEFDHVAMILPVDNQSTILSRELLYTGITRAKSQLTIQANKRVWYQGVNNKVTRHSGISSAKGELL